MTLLSSFPKKNSVGAHPKYPGPGVCVSWARRFRSCLTCPCSLLSPWCKVAQYVSNLHYWLRGSVTVQGAVKMRDKELGGSMESV